MKQCAYCERDAGYIIQESRDEDGLEVIEDVDVCSPTGCIEWATN